MMGTAPRWFWKTIEGQFFVRADEALVRGQRVWDE